MRFGQVARLWDKIHEPGAPEWKALSAGAPQARHRVRSDVHASTPPGRDLMRFRQRRVARQVHAAVADGRSTRRAARITAPTGTTGRPRTRSRGATSTSVWFKLVNDYKKMGGRVTTGSDSGFIYQTYGFGYINELELLQEAGFHPLEVIQAATMNGAHDARRAAGHSRSEFGVVRAGHARRHGDRRPEPARRISRCSTAPARCG